MEKIIWILVVALFLLLGNYVSLTYALRAEEKEFGQGEYRFYLFTAFLWCFASVLGALCLYHLNSPLKGIAVMAVLAGVILAAVIFFLWVIFGTGSTVKATFFSIALSLVSIIMFACLILF